VSAESHTGILRPGPEGYEFWKLAAKGPPVKGPPEGAAKVRHLVCAPPSRAFLALPLWISPQGDTAELAELEFSARHLLRKGCRIDCAEIEAGPDRTLVLGLAVADDPAAPPAGGRAERFEFPARLIDPAGRGLVLWREEGRITFAYFRGGRCVFFSQVPGTVLGPGEAGVIWRAGLRLAAEEVLGSYPSDAVLLGGFTDDEAQVLADVTGAGVLIEDLPPPRLPADACDFAPPSAMAGRERKRRLRRIAVVSILAGAAYLLVLAIAGGIWVVRSAASSKLEAEAAALTPQAEAAREKVERWRVLRPAVDPSLFAIDQLAAVASALPGDTVRLTQLVAGGGKLTVSGEAAEVAQTYEMLEKLKADPRLAEYEWTARPPDIAAKNIIRFEIEGRRPDATADSD